MISAQTDPIKQQVAADWDRRAAHFDEDFGHSIRTAAERAGYDLDAGQSAAALYLQARPTSATLSRTSP